MCSTTTERPTMLHTPYRLLDSSAERLRTLATWLDETASPGMAAAARRAASVVEASATEAPAGAPVAPPGAV